MIHSARIALKLFVTMLLLLGVIYPLLFTFIAQLTMAKEAGGSLIAQGEKVIGSELIGQRFKGEGYFWLRPSAVDFDPLKPAGGSNLSPSSLELKKVVQERMAKLGDHPPAELVYASGSGLDPHISLESAYYQVERVAKKRSLTNEQVQTMIHSLSEGFEHKYINVLKLNLFLDQQGSKKSS